MEAKGLTAIPLEGTASREVQRSVRRPDLNRELPRPWVRGQNA